MSYYEPDDDRPAWLALAALCVALYLLAALATGARDGSCALGAWPGVETEQTR